MRVVAISDQHGHRPTIPPCDLLLVAGDQCIDNFGSLQARYFPDRQWQWFLDVWLKWRYKQPAKVCLATWGNHDFCGLDHRKFRDVRWQLSDDVQMSTSQMTRVACDQLVEVNGLRVYLMPWSNQFMDWAFMAEPLKLARYYEAIPKGIDILVSHQPPQGCGDGAKYAVLGQEGTHSYGSVELREAILRVRPKVVVCGHIHMGYGQYDLDGIQVYNVSVVDEQYQLVHPPTVVWDA